MISARISSKGQITLPRSIRQVLDVRPGDRVLFVVEDETVSIQPMSPSSASALAGSLGRYASKRPDVGTRARQAVKKEVARAAAQEG